MPHEAGYDSFLSGFGQYLSICLFLTVTSPVVINVPTRGLLVVETKDSFVLWLAKFKYQFVNSEYRYY